MDLEVHWGAGAGIYFGNLAEDQSIPLGKNVAVFQAEAYAIQKCVSTLKSISVTGELINIYSDSQSILTHSLPIRAGYIQR